MRKIFIDKNESVGEVMEKILGAEESDVAIVVPRNAALKESGGNFEILKREAEAGGKALLIESVDEDVLELARQSGIESIHPLFSGTTRALSDIVPQEGVPVPEKPKKKTRTKKATAKKSTKKVSLKITPVPPPEEAYVEVEEELRGEAAPMPIPVTRHMSEPDMEMPGAHEEEEEEYASDDRRGFRWLPALLGLGVLIVGGVLITNFFFARADATINFKLIPFQADIEVIASKSIAAADTSKNLIPGELFKDERNMTQLYPASGQATVSQKATGQLTIFNAYGSQPQQLVATTRFATPDGKIFRLDSAVTVPGAEVKDGKIIPSSITVSVTADQAGDSYNVGPTPKLTIPGFQGTPKYQGFYGALAEGAKDGFIGERKTPTEEDVTAAKEKATQVLRSSLQGNILNRRPKDFRLIDNTAEFSVTKLTVNRNTDSSGQFSVFGEAKFQAMGFREDDVKKLLLAQAEKEHPGLVFHEINIAYENAQVSYDRGELRFKVRAQGSLSGDFNEADFRGTLSGQDVNSARALILRLPNLSDAKVEVWPFWLKRLPSDSKRINLEVNYL